MSTGKFQGHHKLTFQIDLCPIKGHLASVILPTALLSKPESPQQGISTFLFSHLVMSILPLRRQICHAFLSILTATAQLVPLPLNLLQFSSSVFLFCLYNPPFMLPLMYYKTKIQTHITLLKSSSMPPIKCLYLHQ